MDLRLPIRAEKAVIPACKECTEYRRRVREGVGVAADIPRSEVRKIADDTTKPVYTFRVLIMPDKGDGDSHQSMEVVKG